MKYASSDRFWAKVEKVEGGCWLWTGTTSLGYGRFRPANGFHYVGAHRFAYEDRVGRIPPGMNVLHKCDNPPCVNPEHLFLGSHADNVADMVRKGRHHVGTNRKLSGMNDDQVRRMRKLYDTGFCTTKELSRLFGISRTATWKIVKRKAWSWVD